MQIDWWTLAIQAINFLILVWLLARFLYRPIRSVIAKREAQSQAAVEEANAKAKEAEEAERALEDRRRELEEQHRDLAAKVHREHEQEHQQMIAKAQAQADEIVATAKERVAAMEDGALKDLKTEVTSLAGKIATRVLANAGEDPIDRVGRYVDDLSDEEREALRNEAADKASPPVIVSSSELSGDDRAAWSQALQQRLKSIPSIKFETDPKILGGAQVRFAHTVLDFTWAHQVTEAANAIMARDHGS